MLRNTLLSLMLSGICGIACAAHSVLTINETDFPSTAMINNSHCSSDIPGGSGITEPHSQNSISGWMVGLACMGSPNNQCTAEIYLDRACKGMPIGTVVFDTTNGYISKQMTSTDYNIDVVDGFTFILKKANA